MDKLVVIGGVTAEYRSLIARTPEEFKTKNNVDVLTKHKVVAIEPENRRLPEVTHLRHASV